MSSTLPQIIARAALHRDRLAIQDRRQAVTYRNLDDMSAGVAVELLGGKADLEDARVAFLVAPGVAHIAIQWGIWRAGGIAVPLPMSYPPAELEFLIRDSGASIVIADPPSDNKVRPIVQAVGARFLMSDSLVPVAEHEPRRGPSVVARGLSPARRAMIIYTSGTTSRPKGVVTTHSNITAQIESLVAAWEWTSADRTLLVLPLHHIHGIINVVCSALWSGAALEIGAKFDPDETWSRLASGELTVFTAVPTIYHRLIQAWEASTDDTRRARSDGSRSLRLMMSGSAALPRAVLDRWAEVTGHVLLERYGMTEVGMALSNPVHGTRRPGFVGRPLPGVSVRLIEGELQLKGAGVFSEYWERPDLTRDAFDAGWFRTGDVAVLEDGDYRLLGRASVDIIKSGGAKLSALEIEEVLRTHPAIDECAVIGVEDPEWGQRVCCVVELRPGAALGLNELRDWARTRLAPYKVPKDLRCVPQLPRNAVGKVIKPQLATFFALPAQPERRDS